MAMTLTEILNAVQAQGLITSGQVNEVLAQRNAFDAQRAMIESTYAGQAVGMAQGTLFLGTTPQDVVNQVQTSLPGALVYAEFPIGPPSQLPL